MSRDEHYVLALCDELLKATASRQHRFDFLRGDPGKSGRCVRLPVDAYYEANSLVIEYRECQHSEPVAIMDRRMTVSGVTRGEQRRKYDQRRRDELPAHKMTFSSNSTTACSSPVATSGCSEILCPTAKSFALRFVHTALISDARLPQGLVAIKRHFCACIAQCHCLDAC